MSLRVQAEADLAVTVEAPGDFGLVFTLTDPAGFTSVTPLYGSSADVGVTVDPDTGLAVSARRATLTARRSSIEAAGYASLPEGTADGAVKPWIVNFAGPGSPTRAYIVKRSWPDRALGVLTMTLELYRVAP